jgi:hypothetical protein
MDTTTFVAFHYTGNDADTAITYLRGSIGGWSPNRRVYVTYNVYHQPLVSIEEVWDGTRWVGAKQSRYYYEKDGLRIADVKSKAVRINLYPNPGVDHLNLQLENADAGKAWFSITTIDGRTLMNWSKYLNGGDKPEQISTDMLPTGTYILKMDHAGTSIAKLFQIIR